MTDEGTLESKLALHRADNDELVRLSDQPQKGPVVLSFYRGQW